VKPIPPTKYITHEGPVNACDVPQEVGGDRGAE
jgi:hypothetical protein